MGTGPAWQGLSPGVPHSSFPDPVALSAPPPRGDNVSTGPRGTGSAVQSRRLPVGQGSALHPLGASVSLSVEWEWSRVAGWDLATPSREKASPEAPASSSCRAWRPRPRRCEGRPGVRVHAAAGPQSIRTAWPGPGAVAPGRECVPSLQPGRARSAQGRHCAA